MVSLFFFVSAAAPFFTPPLVLRLVVSTDEASRAPATGTPISIEDPAAAAAATVASGWIGASGPRDAVALEVAVGAAGVGRGSTGGGPRGRAGGALAFEKPSRSWMTVAAVASSVQTSFLVLCSVGRAAGATVAMLAVEEGGELPSGGAEGVAFRVKVDVEILGL